ncbi:hypothetical protein NLI96_g10729 [Meripilus lineatus]|uniref:SMP-30/Gluconolactonase/LRE-like region domain-containing protein n=1 Tax=Meripilus lineatus TaxID=2056292 RepID=A0AAD5YE24_9APHY|nr:hypothetical protein NLI96_g10729 [Physisporinus lineatus]
MAGRTFLVVVLVLTASFYSQANAHIQFAGKPIPRQSVVIDSLSFTVHDPSTPSRTSSTTQFFNPTNTTPPFFQIFHPAFLDVLGDNPSIRSVASRPTFPFALGAGIWDERTDEVFFASGAGGVEPEPSGNQIAKISLREVERGIAHTRTSTSFEEVENVNVTVTKLDIPDIVQITIGGTGPFRGALLLVTAGNTKFPPSLALVDPQDPSNTTILLDNFFGRQFNSLDDAKIHPKSKTIFFTDTSYGFLNRFRPEPRIPNQVYRFDPDTGEVRVVADGLIQPNAIGFSQDGNTVYISDTAALGGFSETNQSLPATIYAFDVDPRTQAFKNKRIFAYTDSGIPDGIELDSAGNVYGGCGDGVHVWNPQGILIGKFFLGANSADMVFAGKGRLVILAGTNVYLAEIAAGGFNLAF